jgi:hypothetical protein
MVSVEVVMKKKRAATWAKLTGRDVLKHTNLDHITHWGRPPSEEFAHCVRVMWENHHNEQDLWNLRTARICEVFGLPGHRYRTVLCTDWMEFWFQSEQDATMCRLMI